MGEPLEGGGLAPALRILGLIGLSVLAALSTSWWVLGSLLAVPVIWWIGHGRNPARLLHHLRRLSALAATLVLSFLLFPPPGEPRFVNVLGWDVDLRGADDGARMALRLAVIVIGSIVLRETGQPGDLVRGLRRLFVPRPVAETTEAALLLIGQPGGRRRGRGDGGRRRRRLSGIGAAVRNRGAAADRLVVSLKENVERGERVAGVSSDAAVVAAIAVMAMTVKLAKVLPGLPFAPGHKNLLVLPLYVAAAHLTASRLGGTWAGVTLGVVAFLYGEGRFGVLEIAKYVAPGIVIDAAWPVVRRFPNVVVLSVVGLFLAVARLGATLLAGWLAHAPAFFYAVTGAAAVPQFIFGAASGPVSWALLKALSRLPASATTR